jgi:hypothetical protein
MALERLRPGACWSPTTRPWRPLVETGAGPGIDVRGMHDLLAADSESSPRRCRSATAWRLLSEVKQVHRTVIGVSALMLVACSGDKKEATLVVPWRDYEAGLQARIDAMAAANDCQGLTIEFNQIGGTNLAVRTKFGHGNEEVLQYIDTKERGINCYSSTSTQTTV